MFIFLERTLFDLRQVAWHVYHEVKLEVFPTTIYECQITYTIIIDELWFTFFSWNGWGVFEVLLNIQSVYSLI